MSALPLISVVIPTRNRADLLLRAVNSVLSQTYLHLEVIVVIDGPDPRSAQSLQSINDPRLHYFQLETSSGANQARNFGSSLALGDWVALLDDDDEWFPEKLCRQVDVLAAARFDPRTVVSCRFITRGPKGNAVWPRRLPTLQDTVASYIFDCRSLFDGDAALKTSTLLVSKSLIENTQFSSTLKKHQEVDFLMRASWSEKLHLRFAEQVLAVWNVDTARPAINNQRNWRTSLEWIRGHRHKMTRRAYSGFLLVNLAAESSGQGDWKAFFVVFREAILRGNPTAMQVVRYACMWLFPSSLRQKIRLAIGEKRRTSKELNIQDVPA